MQRIRGLMLHRSLGRKVQPALDPASSELVMQSAHVIYSEYMKLCVVLGKEPQQVHQMILDGLTIKPDTIRAKFIRLIYRPILHRVDAALDAILK